MSVEGLLGVTDVEHASSLQQNALYLRVVDATTRLEKYDSGPMTWKYVFCVLRYEYSFFV